VLEVNATPRPHSVHHRVQEGAEYLRPRDLEFLPQLALRPAYRLSNGPARSEKSPAEIGPTDHEDTIWIGRGNCISSGRAFRAHARSHREHLLLTLVTNRRTFGLAPRIGADLAEHIPAYLDQPSLMNHGVSERECA
jgi:hypothetical protein